MRFNIYFWVFLSICIQLPVSALTNGGNEVDYGGGELKASHLSILIFTYFATKSLINKKCISGLPFLLLITVSVVSILNYTTLTAGSLALIFFAVLAYLIGYGLVLIQPDTNEINSGLSTGSTIITIIVFIKLIIYLPELIVGGFYGVAIPTLFSGGPNIEATWISLASLLIRSNFLPVANSFFVAASYGSRAGIIAAAYLTITRFKSFSTNVRYIFLTAMLLIVIPLLYFYAGPVFLRFTDLGSEMEFDIGRIFLWSNALEMFTNNPLGYGVGGAIATLKNLTIDFSENNFHNIYLQILMDGGILVFIFYIVTIIKIINIKSEFSKNSGVRFFLMGYLILGLVQFTGFEMLFWFLLGIFVAKSDIESNIDSYDGIDHEKSS